MNIVILVHWSLGPSWYTIFGPPRPSPSYDHFFNTFQQNQYLEQSSGPSAAARTGCGARSCGHMVNYIHVLHIRSMYKIERRGEGSKNRISGSYPFFIINDSTALKNIVGSCMMDLLCLIFQSTNFTHGRARIV